MLISQSLAKIGVHAAFSEAADGGIRDANDPLAEQIAWHAGFHLPLYQCEQLHGDDVWWVEWGDAGGGADILITRKHNCTLAIRSADCLPIALADANAGVVAVVHAGWRGTARNIVGKAVATMVEIGANPDEIHADFGPAIGDCCFAIDGECLQQLQQVASDGGITQRNQQWFADLATINRTQLLQAGLNATHIASRPLCTCCSPAYFSHRRDRSPWRQLSLIGW